jgi:hypothetical protein
MGKGGVTRWKEMEMVIMIMGGISGSVPVAEWLHHTD